MHAPQQHMHGQRSLHGSLLEPGDVVEPGDKYDSTSGTWQDFPCPGITVVRGSIAVRIVRPVKGDAP